jgi:hypothetical protein
MIGAGGITSSLHGSAWLALLAKEIGGGGDSPLHAKLRTSRRDAWQRGRSHSTAEFTMAKRTSSIISDRERNLAHRSISKYQSVNRETEPVLALGV